MLTAEVEAVLNERASQRAADRLVSQMTRAGKVSGEAFGKALQEEANRTNIVVDQLQADLEKRFRDHGRRSGQSFGSSFSSQLAQSLPGVSGFASAMSGYESAAGRVGALAGRALGLAFTTAAAGLIGAAGYTLFRGFERYQSIDAATNRLENLNRTMQATGRAGFDIQAVMDVVNQSVMDTPFALDQAFSVATRALASNTGDLQRFMTVVTDAAGFAGGSVDEIGEAFLKVANRGKVSMEEIGNELRNMPILPWLQEQMGVSGAALAKMISDGKVGLEDLMRAVETNAAGFAKASGDTVAGAMANAQTAVARLGANFLGALFGKPTQDGNDLVEVLKTIRERIDDVNSWVTAHQGEIKEMFEGAVGAAQDLAGAATQIIELIDRFPGGISGVVQAFVAWKALTIGQGAVAALGGALGGLNTMLGKTLPASAAAGAASMSAALGPVVAMVAALEAVDWRERLNPDDPRNIKNAADRGNWGQVLFGDAWGWFNPTPSAPQDVDPVTGLPSAQATAPSGTRESGGVPAPLPPGLPPGPAPAGGPILPAPGLGDDGGAPKLPPAPVVPYADLPPLDPRLQMTAALFSAQTGVADAMTRMAEKQARLHQLESSNAATAEDVLNARNDLAKAEREAEESKMRFAEAQQNAFERQNKRLEKLNGDLGQIGAQLDDDFGVSKGLAGIAENITRFLANLAMAPVIGALTGVQAAAGYGPGEAGTGLTGVMAGSGMFGPQFQVLPQWARGQQGGASASQMGPAALQPGMAGLGLPPFAGSKLVDSGSRASNPNAQAAAAYLSQMFPGIASIGGSDDRPPGTPQMHTMGRALDIGIGPVTAANQAMGDQINTWLRANASSLGLESTIWRDSWQDFSGNQSTVGGHQDHIHAQFSDALANAGAAGGGGWNANWNAMAQAESSGNWQANTGNGFYGGLQFLPSSWRAAGGTQYAPRADQATPYQQMMTAENLLAMQGPGAWPNTFVPASQGWMGPGVPGGISGGGGQSPVFGAGGPGGLGSSLGASPGGAGGGWFPGMGLAGPAAPSQSVGGGRAFGQGLPASSGIGFGGGLIGLAQSLPGAAAGAAGGMFPGGGAAGAAVGAVAQLGIDQINRAVGAAGQYAGALFGGAVETLSLNGSALADPGRSWVGRLGIAAAGARPALPNTAGALGGAQNENMAEGGKQPPPPLSPQQAEQARADAGRGADAINAKQGNTVNNNISVTNNRAREDGTGRDIQAALGTQAGARMPGR